MSNPSIDSFDASPVKVDVPSELLRKLKGKDIVNNAAQVSNNVSTIAPGMFKIDLEPLAPKLLNNREAHSDYLKYTQEQVTCLKEIVEQGKSLNPVNNSLEYVSSVASLVLKVPVLTVDDLAPVESSSTPSSTIGVGIKSLLDAV
ncbi:hypothetical protein Tco_0726991 [Tanacetum coccineum]|uniref:Uncharacterized protein n=1 Tax=Tanacetum coccineum TaxID=301880 RepID=A0ABQ4YJE4_9ASTR